HARSMLAWLNQLQHARGRNVIFVAVLEKHVDDLNIATWQPQIEGGKTGRELPAIVDEIATLTWVDFGDRKPVRVCVHESKSMGLPGKRSIRKTRSTRATKSRRAARKAHPPGRAQTLHSRFTRAICSSIEEAIMPYNYTDAPPPQFELIP